MATIEEIKDAFGFDIEFFDIEERDKDFVIRSKEKLAETVWRPIHENVVKKKLNGTYSPKEGGWIIPKSAQAQAQKKIEQLKQSAVEGEEKKEEKKKVPQEIDSINDNKEKIEISSKQNGGKVHQNLMYAAVDILKKEGFENFEFNKKPIKGEIGASRPDILCKKDNIKTVVECESLWDNGAKYPIPGYRNILVFPSWPLAFDEIWFAWKDRVVRIFQVPKQEVKQ